MKPSAYRKNSILKSCSRLYFTLVIGALGTYLSAATPSLRTDTRYADPETCASCHEQACKDWRQSDHRRSMDHANAQTVLGDFSDVSFLHIGFDDLLDFNAQTLKILVDDIECGTPPAFPMREYAQNERSANAEVPDLTPVPYNIAGRKFKPALEPHFDDFALACFDAKDGVREKLRSVMNEAQRKGFGAETDYRKSLRVNRPSEIAGAQSRIVSRLRKLIGSEKIGSGQVPRHCATFRLFQQDGKFMVETDIGTYEVRFVLGVRPLQQYLVETEGGRLQCLPVAWDSVDGRWFHLYPKEQIPQSDPLHWAGSLQNWNFMCADCHTTDFRKDFDTKTLAYHSSFVESNVGCQSCHGPCGEHVATARKNSLLEKWSPDYSLGLDTLAGKSGEEIVTSCAACHTRRRTIRAGAKKPLEACLDSFVPEMPDSPIYYPDGQLLEEAFEVGSFMQSKMYAKGVGCTNCHEPHSLKLKFEGNRLCTQCHAPAVYDTVNHHFHPESTKPGTQCVECHFPQSAYMVADPRRDHSIRKPSPELTIKAGVPNACTLCHQDRRKGETLHWAHEHVEEWYAKSRQSLVGYSRPQDMERHYALALEAGRRGEVEALPHLAELIRDKSDGDHRDFLRAAALSLLGRLATPEQTTQQIPLIVDSLEDADPFVRLAAIDAFSSQPVEMKLKYLPPKLDDPLLAMRIEAARQLAGASDRLENEASKMAFQKAGKEFIESCETQNDQAASHLNRAVFEYDLNASKRRQVETWFAGMSQNARNQAELDATVKIRNEYMGKLTEKPQEIYRLSLRIDPTFIPSRINLAMLHNERGETAEAEKQFREILRIDPAQGEAAYSLGLLLAESNRLSEAETMLRKAADLRPENARIRYNLALLLMRQEKRGAAKTEIETALDVEPNNLDFLYALAVLHLQDGRRTEAGKTFDRLSELDPTNPQWKSLRQRAASTPK